ncbi:hypothetical protein [Brucella sp. 2280]|uniref:hypothetical protein n=1 Tax=Brucella sp. 2280 TaxID=2592625 RepID=UPI0012975E13|nr:hypothetical protein [Brucella sp. 2280]QGA57269.1 hypothetical protein GHC20_09350 [Brucella sp. 2280]
MAKWIALNAQKISQELSVQTAPIGHRPRSGINEASRQLGIDSTDAKRAVKVASLSDEAKPDTVSIFEYGPEPYFNPSI